MSNKKQNEPIICYKALPYEQALFDYYAEDSKNIILRAVKKYRGRIKEPLSNVDILNPIGTILALPFFVLSIILSTVILILELFKAIILICSRKRAENKLVQLRKHETLEAIKLEQALQQTHRTTGEIKHIQPSEHKHNGADKYVKRADKKMNKIDFDGAIEYYTKAIEIDPQCFEAFRKRGDVKRYINNYEEALKDYNKALAINEKDFYSYYNRALLFVDWRLGKDKEAILDFTKAIELDSDNTLAFYNRGLLHYKLRNYEQALQDFKKTIELDPGFTEAQEVLHKTNVFIEEKEKAKKLYEKALTLVKKHKYEKAETTLRQAIKLDITNKVYNSKLKEIMGIIRIDILYKSAIESFNNADYKEAELALTELLKKQPDNKQYEALFEKVKEHKINLKSCTKDAILSLDGFDETRAEEFINKREAGQVWYDADSFIQEFEISQPHQQEFIRARLILSPKLVATHGRRVDF